MTVSRYPCSRKEWRDEALFNAEIDTTAAVVALALLAHMESEGRCNPGKERIRRFAKVRDISTVDRAIQRLAAAGLIIVVKTGGGRRVTNWYQASAQTPAGERGLANGNPRWGDPKPPLGSTETPAGERGEVVEVEDQAGESKKLQALLARGVLRSIGGGAA